MIRNIVNKYQDGRLTKDDATVMIQAAHGPGGITLRGAEIYLDPEYRYLKSELKTIGEKLWQSP